MKNQNDRVINGPIAVLAWLGLGAIIVIAAVAGVAYGHQQTAIVALAATGASAGLFSVFATLTAKNKTATAFAVTAALSAVAGLLVAQAERLRQMLTEPDTQSCIIGVTIFLAIALSIVLLLYNREKPEPRGRNAQTSPATTNKDEPDA